MSKGEIVEHVGEGLYRIRQKLAVDRIQAELMQVTDRLAELATALPQKKLELINAENAVTAKAHEIDLKIADLQAGVPGAVDQIARLQSELATLNSTAQLLRLAVADLIAQDLANRKRQNLLQQVPEDKEAEIWCADYSTELTGEVGLVDVNDEGGQGTIIQPGYTDDAAYYARRDGALFPNLAQSGPQIYLNAALLPGVQKWLPRYRVGVISNIVNDSCTVTLDDAESSAQHLNINKEKKLEEVPIQYMDCHAAAFSDGDRVLVRFTQHGPLVVGFESQPKACDIAFLYRPEYSYCSVDYDGSPFIADFYKINFQSYELEPYAQNSIDANTLVPWAGHYVKAGEPYYGVALNSQCRYQEAGSLQPGIISGTSFRMFSSKEFGFYPSKITDDKGVCIGDISDNGFSRLFFINLDSLSLSGIYEHNIHVDAEALEGVVANSHSVIARSYREWPDLYGLRAFDLDMNLTGFYNYGNDGYGGFYDFACNEKYVFAVMWGEGCWLSVHDSKTLAVVYTMNLPYGYQRLAATSSHLIISRAYWQGEPAADGRTEIFKITDDENGFSLGLMKTHYLPVAHKESVLPIA